MAESLAAEFVALTNEQSVYNVLKKEGRKMTISEIATMIPDITERTVRRCIHDLKDKGFVKQFGKRNNAGLFGLTDESLYENSPEMYDEAPIVPFGGELKSIRDFLEIVVSPDGNPLNDNPKLVLLRTTVTHQIRRAMAGVILTSAATGQESYIEHAQTDLLRVQKELEYILRIIKGFNNSTVWFAQVRDRIGYQVRKAQAADPELVQLAIDYVRSE